MIRHHLDLQKETDHAKYVKKALQFYTELADRAVLAGHAVDILACSLDQVGLYELRVGRWGRPLSTMSDDVVAVYVGRFACLSFQSVDTHAV